MDNQIINARLEQYLCSTLEDEENALKEILQELALYALSTTDFFSKALFQGGTSLRILYNLPRFSEDLDFMLKHPDENFRWETYIEKIKKVFLLYGIEPEIKDRSKGDSAIKKMFLKDNSIGKILSLNFHHHSQRKLFIKLEIDTNPPDGSTDEMQYLSFPIDYAILTQDLASNFAGKLHALLCRQYIKGRDWFDFSWYVSRKTPVNFTLFANAMVQSGPWKDKTLNFDKIWLIDALTTKINEIDWDTTKHDTQRFIDASTKNVLDLWGRDYFYDKLRKLNESL